MSTKACTLFIRVSRVDIRHKIEYTQSIDIVESRSKEGRAGVEERIKSFNQRFCFIRFQTFPND